MSARVKTGLVAAAVFLLVLGFGGEAGFGVAVAVAAALGVAEYLRIAYPGASPLEEVFACAWGGLIALGFLLPPPAAPAGLLALGCLIYFGVWVAGPGPRDDTLARWGAVAAAWLLVAFFLGHAIAVRRFGVAPVIFACAVVWAGDTAAYYAGTHFGKTPLAPAVSPKKTVEGAVASVVAAAAVAVLASLVLPLPHGALASGLLGLVLNVAAQVGDLGESLLKRCARVKDSGELFPGHGGLLDRADAFLLVLPVYATVLGLPGVAG